MFPSFLLAFLLLLTFILRRLSRPFSSLPLPPGPRTSWLQRSVTSTYPWITYAKWKEIYGPSLLHSLSCFPLSFHRQTYIGDLIYIRLLGNPLLVLNSIQAVNDLLDKRGHIYSSRPIRPMVVNLYAVPSNTPYPECDSYPL